MLKEILRHNKYPQFLWMFFYGILYIERRVIMDKDRYIEYVNNNFDGKVIK